MYSISKTFHWSAAHHLPHLPEGHQCRNPHGHNYQAEITLTSPSLDLNWFVLDYGELAPFKEYIDTTFDHHDLNEVLTVPTTAENIAKHLYEYAKNIWKEYTIVVRISETTSTWASYTV